MLCQRCPKIFVRDGTAEDLYFELLFWNGRYEDAEKLLAADSHLAQLYYGYFEETS